MRTEKVVRYKNNSVVVGTRIRSDRKLYIIIISILLVLQSGLRNVAVGADTYAYYSWFEEIKSTSWDQIFETNKQYFQSGEGKDPGYLIFQKISQLIITNYQVYLIFIALILFVSLGFFIYYNTRYIKEAMFAFVLFSVLFYPDYSITAIRQSIGAAVSLWAFEFIKRKKLIPFILIILIASSIHKSVLIFLPFYFIANLKQTKLIYTFSILVFPLVMIFRRTFAYYIALASGSEDYMEFALSNYKAGTPTFTLLMIAIMILGWIFMKDALKMDPRLTRVYNAMALAFVFTPLTWVDPNLMRVVIYFSIFMLLFIPKVIEAATLKQPKLSSIIYIGLYIILIVLVIKVGGEYKFFWEYMQLGKNY
jgi:transmembrane protein EpsG